MGSRNSKENIQVKNPKLEIESSSGPILVDFFASWCGPCKILAPIIENIHEKYEGSLKVIKVDVDEHPDLSEEYEIRSVPTLLFFSGGKLIRREVGFMSEDQISKIIESELMI